MGICFSEPPIEPQGRVLQTARGCRQCGAWLRQTNVDICEICLQKNALNVIAPPQQYTYAVSYPQQQMYYPQPQQPHQLYYQPPQQLNYPQQQRQMGTVGAIATGFVVGALIDDILDPMD